MTRLLEATNAALDEIYTGISLSLDGESVFLRDGEGGDRYWRIIDLMSAFHRADRSQADAVTQALGNANARLLENHGRDDEPSPGSEYAMARGLVEGAWDGEGGGAFTSSYLPALGDALRNQVRLVDFLTAFAEAHASYIEAAQEKVLALANAAIVQLEGIEQAREERERQRLGGLVGTLKRTAVGLVTAGPAGGVGGFVEGVGEMVIAEVTRPDMDDPEDVMVWLEDELGLLTSGVSDDYGRLSQALNAAFDAFRGDKGGLEFLLPPLPDYSGPGSPKTTYDSEGFIHVA